MKTIEEVRAYWDANPCQVGLSRSEERRVYFQEISNRRYAGRDRHVPIVANFHSFCGKDVLEIGCGLATDGFEFARNGARYTGVDLTPHAIGLARERFELARMPGRLEVANAEEELPFSDCSFDHVYSFGVIHHSPAPDKIVHEIHRVLRKGGTFTVMLYNRTSINYYVEILFLRRVLRRLLMPRFMPRLLASATGFERWKLEGHRRILREKKRISKEEWVSVNTDGPFCPLARVYSSAEAAKLFEKFGSVRQEVWEFNVEHWSVLRRIIPDFAEAWAGRHWGWHRMIYGEKL